MSFRTIPYWVKIMKAKPKLIYYVLNIQVTRYNSRKDTSVTKWCVGLFYIFINFQELTIMLLTQYPINSEVVWASRSACHSLKIWSGRICSILHNLSLIACSFLFYLYVCILPTTSQSRLLNEVNLLHPSLLLISDANPSYMIALPRASSAPSFQSFSLLPSRSSFFSHQSNSLRDHVWRTRPRKLNLYYFGGRSPITARGIMTHSRETFRTHENESTCAVFFFFFLFCLYFDSSCG